MVKWEVRHKYRVLRHFLRHASLRTLDIPRKNQRFACMRRNKTSLASNHEMWLVCGGKAAISHGGGICGWTCECVRSMDGCRDL